MAADFADRWAAEGPGVTVCVNLHGRAASLQKLKNVQTRCIAEGLEPGSNFLVVICFHISITIEMIAKFLLVSMGGSGAPQRKNGCNHLMAEAKSRMLSKRLVHEGSIGVSLHAS